MVLPATPKDTLQPATLPPCVARPTIPPIVEVRTARDPRTALFVLALLAAPAAGASALATFARHLLNRRGA